MTFLGSCNLHCRLSLPNVIGESHFRSIHISCFMMLSQDRDYMNKFSINASNIMRQSACLVFNPVNNFISLFNCTPVGRASDSMMAPGIKLFILVGLGRSFFVCCLAHRGSTVGFLLLQFSSGVVRHPRDLQVSVATRFCRVLIFASS